MNIKLFRLHHMMGSNQFSPPQERLHCDYVTNVLREEMILDIPHLVYTL